MEFGEAVGDIDLPEGVLTEVGSFIGDRILAGSRRFSLPTILPADVWRTTLLLLFQYPDSQVPHQSSHGQSGAGACREAVYDLYVQRNCPRRLN